MSNQYLDKYRSSLPTTQGNQILKLLVKKRDSGEIKNVDEFKNKLKMLTAEILAERITPTLKLFDAVPGLTTSSEQYNEMLDRIQDDLESAFSEADTLDEIIIAHNNLINGVALKALRYGINELESKINLYEFLNKSTQGFDSANFNTFRESLNHITSRADSAAAFVYIDPRVTASIDSSQDAEVDLIGERLILGADTKKYLDVRNVVWLSNNNSIRSEFNVAFENSQISNIIDNTKNTYWVEPILLRDIRQSGTPMEIGLNLNSSQDVNFVEIEPASDFPMVLVGVDYFDGSNSRQTAGANEVLLSGPTRINFEKITTKHLILRVKQDNYSEVQFKKKLGESNFHKAVLGQSSNTVDLDSVNEDLQDLLSSDFILSDIMGIRTPNLPSFKYYQYILGFDNLRVGFSTFQDRGIYVTEVQRVDNLSQIALRVDEIRPVQEAGSGSVVLEPFNYPAEDSIESNKFYHGVFEYWALLQFYAEDDYLISTDVVPLLPLGAERVYHEQLIFTAQSSDSINPNVGQLMFFADADENDIFIYRNGDLLTYGTNEQWEFVDPGETDPAGQTITTIADKPLKRAIKINEPVGLLDIFTVSYTPKKSNTFVASSATTSLANVIDVLGNRNAHLVNDNLVVFNGFRLGQKVAYVDTYLIILMRRNSALESFSPALEEYMLVTGSKNPDKFIR